MVPLQAAALFSTIVSLIRIFKQERGDRKKADRQAFMDWLDYHRHEDLKNFIANTAAVRTEVDSILSADHALMLQKLDGIQELVATLLSRVDEFRGLSLAIAPDAQLSEQAVSILRQFNDSGDETLAYERFGPGSFCLQTDQSEPFGITDPRFLQNDLEQLVGLGLLTVKQTSEGKPLFLLTRPGVSYLRAIDAKSPTQGENSSPKSSPDSSPDDL
jgi:hypothetical protein